MKPLETETRLAFQTNDQVIDLAVKEMPPRDNASGDDPKNPQPGLVWLGGFRSDMTGTKAQCMVDAAADLGIGSMRFDYSGHGASGGRLEDGSISDWVAQSLHVIRSRTSGPQILLGSSMGGWVALRLIQELQKTGDENRVAGLILIAPAPDFTKRLMEPKFSEVQKRELEEKGYLEEPSAYSDEPNIITRHLIEDGAKNSVLDDPLRLGVPVTILQGMNDPDVPWQHAMALVENLVDDDISVTLVKDGDHRLSRDQDLELLRRTISQMVERAVAA